MRKGVDKVKEARRYKKQVKELFAKCKEQDIEVRGFKNKKPNDICILSKDEYEILSPSEECKNEENEPYFIDYIDWRYYYEDSV